LVSDIAAAKQHFKEEVFIFQQHEPPSHTSKKTSVAEPICHDFEARKCTHPNHQTWILWISVFGHWLRLKLVRLLTPLPTFLSEPSYIHPPGQNTPKTPASWYIGFPWQTSACY
jgi:hypothetical protein